MHWILLTYFGYESRIDKIQRRICHVIGPHLASLLQWLSHYPNIAFLKHFHGNCSDNIMNLSITLNRQLDFILLLKLLNVDKVLWICSLVFFICGTLSTSCFPVNYDLQKFKCNMVIFYLYESCSFIGFSQHFLSLYLFPVILVFYVR